MRLAILILIMILSNAVCVNEVKRMNVATGDKKGTYSRMFKDIGKVCKSTAYLLEKGTTGSPENVSLLINNQTDLAFVQLDVLVAQKTMYKNKKVDNIKALLPLYPEEIHLLAKAKNKSDPLFPKSTGEKHIIAAWGGSYITAGVINAKTNFSYKIREYKDRKAALNALDEEKVDAIMAVVGEPAKWIENLKAEDYQLLPIQFKDIQFQKGLKDIYSQAEIQYRQYAMKSIPTIAVRSVLVTRNFKSKERKESLLKYRDCAIRNLLRLREEYGMHSKWNDVDFESFQWPKYE